LTNIAEFDILPPVKKIPLQVVFVLMNPKKAQIGLPDELVNQFTSHKQEKLTNQFSCQELDEIVQLSILYDFYGELLNSHKRQIFEDYVLNDLSLSEIAADQGISRQGVYDIVKRCSQELRDFESKLHLINKFQTVKEKLGVIKSILSETKQTGDMTRVTEIETLADDILKEL
jgi:predicted DNA-binding protein YlxM (UPF0122 family)